MSSTYMEAADNAKSLARLLKGVIQVGEILEGIGSLDLLEKETRARADKVMAEAAKAEQQLLEVNRQLADASAALETAESKLAATRSQSAELKAAISQMRQDILGEQP